MNRLLVIIICLLIAGVSQAVVANNMQLDADLVGENSMTWPMLPGESVNEIAYFFYPKDRAMQQVFVKYTLRLNADMQLTANQRFNTPTALVVPTQKSLSTKAAIFGNKRSKNAFNMSYSLKHATEVLPEKLKQEYETLLNKNAFLKEQLATLNKNIVFLEAKLGELKLIFDKKLHSDKEQNSAQIAQATPAPAAETEPKIVMPQDVPVTVESAQTTPTTPQASVPVGKKVFKNLNKQAPLAKTAPVPAEPAETSWLDTLDMDLVKTGAVMLALMLLGAIGLKKYRERMMANLSFVATKMRDTVTDFSGYVEKPKQDKAEPGPGPQTIMQLQAAKEVESRLSATLEEAKLLMSVNRGADAIAHLKLTIESQPKASINHWLYLLEVFRKLNLKDDFENYAKQMNETFNVMTPVWYEKEASINTVLIVPQSLEEFPHIMDQLYGVWPGELASVYLRSLITDNRGGERTGFGKAVVAEILFLIELLDTHKDIPN